MTDWLNFFFSFKGRFNRARYWGATGILVVAMIAIAFLGYFMAKPANETGNDTAMVVLIMVMAIPAFVSSLAVMIRRLHDRNKSGHWVLLFYFAPNFFDKLGESFEGPGGELTTVTMVSYGLTLGLLAWGVVELGILKGTAGPNKYGDDPLSVTHLNAETVN